MKILGVGELASLSMSSRHGRIKTYGLGSCVALVVIDRQVKAVGMAHIALPDSIYNPKKAKVMPGYFADTAVPVLLSQMRERGSRVAMAGNDVEIKLVGGGMAIDNGIFRIGERNVQAIIEVLNKYGLTPNVMDVGGQDISRTIEVHASTGVTVVWYNGSRVGKEI